MSNSWYVAFALVVSACSMSVCVCVPMSFPLLRVLPNIHDRAPSLCLLPDPDAFALRCEGIRIDRVSPALDALVIDGVKVIY